MNQKQQLDLAKLSQEKNARLAELFTERLDTEFFPPEFITSFWKANAFEAISKSCPLAHKLSLADFAKAIKCTTRDDDKITLFEFGVLCNSIDTVSPDMLSLDFPLYLDLIDETVKNIHEYGLKINKIRDAIQSQVETEFKMKAVAAGGMKAITD